MCRRVFFSLLLAVGMAGVFVASGHAQVPRDAYGPRVEPLDRVLPAIRERRAGRFFDAEGPFPDAVGRYHYRIKWLTPEGRVIWLDADAHSGRVLGVARGDWRAQGPPPAGPFEGGIGPRFQDRPAARPFAPPGNGIGRGGFGGGWRGGVGRWRRH